jgi:uncharacterized protein YajQ (UPF0234 family)
MTKQEVKTFRGDFQKAVAQLEEQYGCNISLGTIRYDVNGLSAKMKAEKGEKIVRATKDDFQVGDVVGINHKKVNPNDMFIIYKINSKNIGVKGANGQMMRVTPSLLIKK